MALWPGVHRSRALRLALSLFHGSMLPPTSCRSLHRSAHRARGGRILVERNGQWVYLPRSILNEDRHAVPRRRPPRTTEADAVPATSQATVAPEPTTSRTVTATTAAERLKKVLRAEPEVKTFEGVEVPARPLAPASDQCCMSGCARCIYDLYAEDLQDYSAALFDARAALTAKGVPQSTWPAVLATGAVAASREDAVRRAEEEAAADVSDLDISMREFLSLERSIRRRNLERQKTVDARQAGALAQAAQNVSSAAPPRRAAES